MNWESINKKDKNTIVKENEKEFYLGKIIENTKDEGREIVLIIDESHHHATSEISQNLIADIGTKIRRSKFLQPPLFKMPMKSLVCL